MKKLLALVLALVMSMSLVTISNAAFKDADKIDYKEAVEVMSALGVINGMPDGSFTPAGNVTRAEMAKMISIIALGNVDAAAFIGTATDLTDINGHWAEGFIKYCYSQGIISGRGNGLFDPNANVTAVEAAKMLLVAIGYNAKVQEYVGNDWQINVIRDAQTSKFFDKLSITSGKVLTRDEAAQMIYNAVQAKTIQKSSSVDRLTGKVTDIYDADGDPLLKKTFNAVIANSYLNDFSYDSTKAQWTYDFVNVACFGAAAPTGDVMSGSLKSKADYTELFGQKVKVIYDQDKSDVIYGVYNSGSKVVASGVTGDAGTVDTTANTAKVNGVAYKFDNVASTALYYTGVSTPQDAAYSMETLKNDHSAYSFKLVDNDDDNKVDAIIVTPMNVAKVTYMNKDIVTVGSPLSTSYNRDDIVLDSSIVKGDYALVTAAAYSKTGDITLTKLELKTGKVDAAKGGTGAATYTDYQIGGNWYVDNGINAEVNDTVEYVSYGNVIYYAKVTDAAATTKNIATVITTRTVGGDNLDAAGVEAKLLFTDGSKKTVKVAKVDGAATTLLNVTALIGDLLTYRINSDGEYELTSVSATNLAGYKTFSNSAAYATATESVAGAVLADDAIVLVVKSGRSVSPEAPTAANSNEGKVYSGKEIKRLGADYGVAGAALTAVVDGFSYGKVAAIQATALPTIAKGGNYGYLTAATYRTSAADKTYLNFTMWTANGEVTAKMESTDSPADYAKGAIVTYDTKADGEIKNVTIVNAITSVVTGWDGKEKIQIAGLGSSKVDATDTTVIYIDSAEKKGVTGGEIAIGEDLIGDDDIADQNNIRYVGNGTLIDLLVVDVNNKMAAAPAMALANSANLTDVNNALTGGDVSIAGTVSLSGNVVANGHKFVGGGTLSVTGTIDETASISTEVNLSNNMTLPAPDIKIGTVSGTIGSGSTLFGAGDLNGQALYQFTVPGFVSGKTTLHKAQRGAASPTTVNSAIATADDLYVRFSSGDTVKLTIDFDGNVSTTEDQKTFTVTAPTF